MRIPRDIYKHAPVHEYHGVRCVDCGGKVYDTPAYVHGVQWRCSACTGRPGWVVMPMKDEYKGYDWSGGR